MFSSSALADDNQMVDDLWKTPSETDMTEDEKPASAQDTTENETAEFGFFDFLRAIAAMVFVIALLLFLLKYINKKSRTYQSGYVIQNLGGNNLGSNKSIQIVKIGSSVYVVGVGEDVHLLKEITNQEEIEQLLKEHNQSIEQVLAPSDIFSKWIRKKKDGKEEHFSFSNQFKQQMEEMKLNREQLRKELQRKVKRDDE